MALSVMRCISPNQEHTPQISSLNDHSAWSNFATEYTCKEFDIQYLLGNEQDREKFLGAFQSYWSSVRNCPCTAVPIVDIANYIVFDLFKIYEEVAHNRGGYTNVSFDLSFIL